MVPGWVPSGFDAPGVGFEGLAMQFWSKIDEIWPSASDEKPVPGSKFRISRYGFRGLRGAWDAVGGALRVRTEWFGGT